jgi:hypothetical protein
MNTKKKSLKHEDREDHEEKLFCHVRGFNEQIRITHRVFLRGLRGLRVSRFGRLKQS